MWETAFCYFYLSSFNHFFPTSFYPVTFRLFWFVLHFCYLLCFGVFFVTAGGLIWKSFPFITSVTVPAVSQRNREWCHCWKAEGVSCTTFFTLLSSALLIFSSTLKQSLLSENWLLSHFTRMLTSLGNKVYTEEGMTYNWLQSFLCFASLQGSFVFGIAE